MGKSIYENKKKKNQIGLDNYNQSLLKNKYGNRYNVFIATPATGLVRMEWAMARFGQIIPCNWGYKAGVAWLPSFSPLGYCVADAQNLSVKRFIDEDCEWLMFVEQDNILPHDCFLRFNEHMRKMTAPIISGLYYTKSCPAEPMVYRGRGNSYFEDWKIGDKVWVDAIPMGCVIMHKSIIKHLWDNSPEYKASDQVTRRVFHTPEMSWSDPEKGINNSTGTSDLEFCARLIEENVFEKTGWKKIAKKEFPFLIDTNIFVGHMDQNGVMFPSEVEKKYWSMDLKKRKNIFEVV